MKAKYAGTCSRTGRRYSAGTEIEKYDGGWAIAGASPASEEIRAVRVDGVIRHENIARIKYCKCARTAGIDIHNEAALAPYTLTRSGDDLTCHACGRVIHILSAEEEWMEETLPNLYLEDTGAGYYALSRKIPAEKWDLVKRLFTFWSADDLDEMDVFDHPGGWFLRPGKAPTGVLNSAMPAERTTAEEVEDLLGILPDNRLAVREPRLAAEAAARRAEEAARDTIIRNLYDAFRDGGEYLTAKDGFEGTIRGEMIDHPRNPPNVYGGGSWFVLDDDGAHIWHVSNNGMDGDDWSRNNVRTGGAGAIGYRFESTPERLDLLRQARPDRMAEIESQRSAKEAERALLAGLEPAPWDLHQDVDLNSLEWTRLADAAFTARDAAKHGYTIAWWAEARSAGGRIVARWVDGVGPTPGYRPGILAGAANGPRIITERHLYVDRPVIEHYVRARISRLTEEAGEVAVAQKIVSDALWEGDHDYLCRKAVEIDGLDHWLTIARREPFRVADARELPDAPYAPINRKRLPEHGIEVVLMTRVNPVEFGVTAQDVLAYAKEKWNAGEFASVGLFRSPDGDLWMKIDDLGSRPVRWVRPGEPNLEWTEAGRIAKEKAEAEAAERQLTKLRERLVKAGIAQADAVKGITVGKQIDHAQISRSSGGAECWLHQVTLHDAAADRCAYQVKWVWGYMGEDGEGDSGEDYAENLADARANYESFKSSHIN